MVFIGGKLLLAHRSLANKNFTQAENGHKTIINIYRYMTFVSITFSC